MTGSKFVGEINVGGHLTTVLVTGAAGFIGSHVVERLLALGYTVRAVDCFLNESYSAEVKRLAWNRLANLRGVELVELDLRTGDSRWLLRDVDVVVNEAAMPGLIKSWSHFDLYSSCNLSVVRSLLAACADSGAYFVQASTSSVYGAAAVGNETLPLAPVSPYGATKLAAEELIKAYSRTFNVQYGILRYFSVYGPRQRPDMAYHRIIQAILNGNPVIIYGDGLQSRTNTYVSDVVEATVATVVRQPSNMTFNVSGNEEASLLKVLALIEEASGKSAIVEHRDARPGDQRRTVGDSQLAREILGFTPKTSLQSGIAEQVEWHMSANSFLRGNS